jgi:hypothetical protein
VAEHDLAPAFADGRGILADLAAALLAAGLLASLSRWSVLGRWIGAAAAAAWTLLNFANYEHIRELGSVIGFSYAGYIFDEAFLLGSAADPTRPLLLTATCIGSVVLAWLALTGERRFRAWPLLITGAAGSMLLAVVPLSTESATWRQTDVFGSSLRRALPSSGPLHTAGEPQPGGLLERDLAGSPIIEAGPRARNVLLVILEGVSGAYLESLRETVGANSPIDMPELDQIAGQGLAYSSFVATQRQTNRGEYALLCGDYPTLVTSEAKMSLLAGAGPVDCLPAILRDAGFRTVYLQASPLPFMMKDQFMAQAGFDRVLGNSSFPVARNRNHWGVDDRTLFEAATELIAGLNEDPRPWFLTLLTVGTHHRYNVPPDFAGTAPVGSKAWAFEYLDAAVGELVDRLEAAGVLDDTLVLITSDESQADDPGGPDAVNMMTHGWGLLIALSPSGQTGIVNQVFAQPDVPLSVLDYLDATDLRTDLPGRSFFRRYEHDRAVFWANTHLGLVAGLGDDNTLTICTEDFARCISTPTESGRLFASPGTFEAADERASERMRHAARRSLSVGIVRPSRRSVSLIGPGPHPVASDAEQQYLFGGQFLTLPAGSRTDVDLSLSLSGGSGWLDFAHNFLVRLEPRKVWSERLEVGERLDLSYSFTTPTELGDAEFRFWITGFEGADLRLDVERATVEISPDSGDHGPGSERFEITRVAHPTAR